MVKIESLPFMLRTIKKNNALLLSQYLKFSGTGLMASYRKK